MDCVPFNFMDSVLNLVPESSDASFKVQLLPSLWREAFRAKQAAPVVSVQLTFYHIFDGMYMYDGDSLEQIFQTPKNQLRITKVGFGRYGRRPQEPVNYITQDNLLNYINLIRSAMPDGSALGVYECVHPEVFLPFLQCPKTTRFTLTHVYQDTLLILLIKLIFTRVNDLCLIGPWETSFDRQLLDGLLIPLIQNGQLKKLHFSGNPWNTMDYCRAFLTRWNETGRIEAINFKGHHTFSLEDVKEIFRGLQIGHVLETYENEKWEQRFDFLTLCITPEIYLVLDFATRLNNYFEIKTTGQNQVSEYFEIFKPNVSV
ncbi:hypothetical protein L596_021499 [Steinernema carpocapsae]|uniref:Uncharacterized protein n=1 Tax=Steinernema carpocapsae TaxID=34508 RepID=A0A4U5MJR5_STECR|nr:hypothetical protein L596_021499 [Steinernema carpocapsae]